MLSTQPDGAAVLHAGSAVQVLRVLARLPQLQSVDLQNQFLTGTLPPEVAFPSLQVLQLAENFISVRPFSLLFMCLTAEPPCSRLDACPHTCPRSRDLAQMHAQGLVIIHQC
jgi:hypothetical protein